MCNWCSRFQINFIYFLIYSSIKLVYYKFCFFISHMNISSKVQTQEELGGPGMNFSYGYECYNDLQYRRRESRLLARFFRTRLQNINFIPQRYNGLRWGPCASQKHNVFTPKSYHTISYKDYQRNLLLFTALFVLFIRENFRRTVNSEQYKTLCLPEVFRQIRKTNKRYNHP